VVIRQVFPGLLCRGAPGAKPRRKIAGQQLGSRNLVLKLA